MKINKKKLMLYKAFNDGIITRIRQDKLRKIEDIHVLLDAKGQLASEFGKKHKEIAKKVNDTYEKYELNEEEQKYYFENVRDTK